MSAIVPWNDPGGTPCCCTSPCEYFFAEGFDDSFLIALTESQYASIFAGGYFETLFEISAQYNVASYNYDVADSYSLTHRIQYNKPANSCFIDNTFTLLEASATHSPSVTLNSGVDHPATTYNTIFQDSTNSPPSTPSPTTLFGLGLRIHDTNGPTGYPFGARIEISGQISYSAIVDADWATFANGAGPYDPSPSFQGYQRNSLANTHTFQFRSARSTDTPNQTINLIVDGNNIPIDALQTTIFSVGFLYVSNSSSSGSFTTLPQITFVPFPP
jgi:hypothetical protein